MKILNGNQIKQKALNSLQKLNRWSTKARKRINLNPLTAKGPKNKLTQYLETGESTSLKALSKGINGIEHFTNRSHKLHNGSRISRFFHKTKNYLYDKFGKSYTYVAAKRNPHMKMLNTTMDKSSSPKFYHKAVKRGINPVGIDQFAHGQTRLANHYIHRQNDMKATRQATKFADRVLGQYYNNQNQPNSNRNHLTNGKYLREHAPQLAKKEGMISGEGFVKLYPKFVHRVNPNGVYSRKLSPIRERPKKLSLGQQYLKSGQAYVNGIQNESSDLANKMKSNKSFNYDKYLTQHPFLSSKLDLHPSKTLSKNKVYKRVHYVAKNNLNTKAMFNLKKETRFDNKLNTLASKAKHSRIARHKFEGVKRDIPITQGNKKASNLENKYLNNNANERFASKFAMKLDKNPKLGKRLNMYSGSQALDKLQQNNSSLQQVINSKRKPGLTNTMKGMIHDNQKKMSQIKPGRIYTGEMLNPMSNRTQALSPKAIKQNVHVYNFGKKLSQPNLKANRAQNNANPLNIKDQESNLIAKLDKKIGAGFKGSSTPSVDPYKSSLSFKKPHSPLTKHVIPHVQYNPKVTRPAKRSIIKSRGQSR